MTSTGSSSRPDPIDAPETAAQVRAVLASLGVRPDRRYGQSFLIDPFVADAEAALAVRDPTLPVLEIGGGLGILTSALLRRGARDVTVIERDTRLAGFLRTTFGARIRVVEGDARDLPLPTEGVAVGNLPFSVGTPIVERLLTDGPPRTVALLQKEVANRLAAREGSKAYGRLSIFTALFGSVEAFAIVPSRAFDPAPAVEGRIVEFTRRDGPLPVPEPAALEAVLAALFSRRRKQLKNLLPRAVPAGRTPASFAEAADWPTDWATRRPEELPPEAFFRLARAVVAARPHRQV